VVNLFFWLAEINIPYDLNIYEMRVVQVSVFSVMLCDIVCQWLATDRLFSPGTPVSSTNKNDRHDIIEMYFLFLWNHFVVNLFFWLAEINIPYDLNIYILWKCGIFQFIAL
jgi:hypothetical protein